MLIELTNKSLRKKKKKKKKINNWYDEKFCCVKNCNDMR